MRWRQIKRQRRLSSSARRNRTRRPTTLNDALNFRDDQFDLSDALTALAISLLALTSLTGKRGLFVVALVATALGMLMGIAGLAGWHAHPDAITRLLS